MRRLLALLSLLSACATLNPPTAVYTVTVGLTQLEYGMAIYCERADRDADVCASARAADKLASDALAAANAARKAGEDPTAKLEAAQAAFDVLIAIAATVGVQ